MRIEPEKWRIWTWLKQQMLSNWACGRLSHNSWVADFDHPHRHVCWSLSRSCSTVFQRNGASLTVKPPRRTGWNQPPFFSNGSACCFYPIGWCSPQRLTRLDCSNLPKYWVFLSCRKSWKEQHLPPSYGPTGLRNGLYPPKKCHLKTGKIIMNHGILGC